jgi:hypothetical protein
MTIFSEAWKVAAPGRVVSGLIGHATSSCDKAAVGRPPFTGRSPRHLATVAALLPIGIVDIEEAT